MSRPVGEVLTEARKLFEAGVKELLVVSQDTSAYGVDVQYRTGFWDGKPVRTRMYDLVRTLGEMARGYGAWVRLHYVYPLSACRRRHPADGRGAGAALSRRAAAAQPPDVLKRMKRPASGEKNIERIQRWREICPEMVIRSTFIAGFPGETETEFAHLLDFVREAQIDRAGCFAYSPVDGALANELPGALPDAVREERRARFMAVAEQVSISGCSARRRHHAGAGRSGAEPGQEGRGGHMPTHPRSMAWCGCCRPRGQQDLQGRRPRQVRIVGTQATTWSDSRSDRLRQAPVVRLSAARVAVFLRPCRMAWEKPCRP